VLELTKSVLEYGFFTVQDLPKLSMTLVKVCKSLGKLEEAWNEKYQKEEDEFEEE
jgi:hypothetical protein